jgi:urea transporter
MTRSVALVEYVFRGYGQLFVTNNVGSGLLYAAALFCMSPSLGTLSLLAAGLMSVAAYALSGSTSTVRSGLYGVNGVLLGAVWSYVPEISWIARCLATVIGAIAMTLAIYAATEWFRRHKIGITLFSLPYVLYAWCILALLYPSGEAGRSVVQGWASFRQQDYTAARAAFEQALAKNPQLAEAYDGLGWTAYRFGEFPQATNAFQAAIANDSWLADSWNGLGWIAFNTTVLSDHALDDAEQCFVQSALRAPLCSDTYDGLARIWFERGEYAAANMAKQLSTLTTTYIPRILKWTPITTLLAWVLFAVGIVWHSRWSACMATVSIAFSCAVANFWYAAPGTALDVTWLMNIAAISVALGGHYSRPGVASFLCTLATCSLVTIAWGPASAWCATYGLPLLCAPFNVALVGSLCFASGLQRAGVAKLAVPLEVAVTSPEAVRLWTRRCAIAERSWKRLAA